MSGTVYVRRNSEDAEQETVIRWARLSSGAWPDLALLYHIPNGGSRNAKEAAKLKRMGVLAGVPDLFLPAARAGYNGLYIEMKYGDGRISPHQKEFMQQAAYRNYFCAACYSAADAIELLQSYVNTKRMFRYENLTIIKGGEAIGKIK